MIVVNRKPCKFLPVCDGDCDTCKIFTPAAENYIKVISNPRTEDERRHNRLALELTKKELGF